MDPVEDGLNRYGYVGNNPITRTDASGLISYTADDVAYCQKKLRIAALAVVFPCASKLLGIYLGIDRPPQTFDTFSTGVCPRECKIVTHRTYRRVVAQIMQDWAAWREGSICLSNPNPSIIFVPGEGTFEKRHDADLYYAIHRYRYYAFLTGGLDCRKTETRSGCCCSCTFTGAVDFTLTDTYDFCSSLDPDEPPRSLPWCGCVLQLEGIGRVFEISCRERFGISGATMSYRCQY